MNKKKICAILTAFCLSVGICMPVSAAGNPNVTVFEAEADSFYYPASDAKLLHDGHGNFTVSGLTGGAISSDDFLPPSLRPKQAPADWQSTRPDTLSPLPRGRDRRLPAERQIAVPCLLCRREASSVQ